MNAVCKVLGLGFVLAFLCTAPVEKVHAAGGHENNCVVTEVSYGWGTLYIMCGSGTINAAFLPSSVHLPAGCSLTSDLDSIKIWLSIAMAARVSDKTLTIWYTDICGGYARIIAGVNMVGN